MKNQLVTAFAILLVSFTAEAVESCKPTQYSTIPVITELNYHDARKALIKSGWQPLQTKSFNEAYQASEDPDTSSGNGATFWELGYIEVEGCSGTGISPCAFLFKDVHGTQLRVTTAGEENSSEKAFASVNGFSFVCTTVTSQ